MIDAITEHFAALGVPLDREQWIYLNWPDGPPVPMTAEDEEQVPAQYRIPDAPPAPPYVDAITEHFAALGERLTREQWIYLNWPDGPPSPWTAEDEEQIPAMYGPAPTPPATRQEVATAWNTAGAHLDASELELRDAIERELVDHAGLRGMNIAEANKAIKRVMKHVKRIRGAAFRKAFRHVLDETDR